MELWRKIYNSWQKKRLTDSRYEYLFNDIDGDVVVFDTETTGLNPKKDEIISIGAVKIRDNRILLSQKFEIYLKTDKSAGEDSIKIHRIRNCDIENGADIDSGIEQFLQFIGGSTLVGYYLQFDVSMVNRYLKPKLGIKLPNRQIEVSALYFDKKIELIPQGNVDLRFDSIMRDLNIPFFGKHNSLNDAVMTAMIYLKLI
jgi:DNA polymerase-3 subunit epsilon